MKHTNFILLTLFVMLCITLPLCVHADKSEVLATDNTIFIDGVEYFSHIISVKTKLPIDDTTVYTEDNPADFYGISAVHVRGWSDSLYEKYNYMSYEVRLDKSVSALDAIDIVTQHENVISASLSAVIYPADDESTINAEAFITKDTDVVYIVKTNESIYLPQYEDGSVKQFFGVEIVAIKQIEDNIYYVAIKSENMVNALEVWRYDPKIEHVALLSNIPQRHSDMILLRVTKDIGSKQYENEDVFEFHNISFDNIYCLTIRNSGLTKQEILEKDGYLEFVGMVNTTDLYETVSILKTYDDVLYIEPIFLDLYPDYDYDSIRPADINEPIIKIGDINANEKIDMTDYILLKRAHFGTYTLDESQKARGDINENGKIDMTDYILLKRMYFGTWVYEEHQSTEDEVLPDDTKQANQFKIKVKEFINLEDYKNQNSSSLYGVEITDIRPKFDESKPHNVIDIYYVIATKDSYTAAELTQLFKSEDNVLSCMTHCEDLPN